MDAAAGEGDREKERDRKGDREIEERDGDRDEEREGDMDRKREARAAMEFNFDQAGKLKQRHLAARGGDRARSLLAVALAVKRLEMYKER